VWCEVRRRCILGNGDWDTTGGFEGKVLMLKCGGCGRTVETLPEGRLRCPHCGSHLLYKLRKPIVKRVKAE
jgi:DNA-directed RNA polymerase subunit RPC12/RpoP